MSRSVPTRAFIAPRGPVSVSAPGPERAAESDALVELFLVQPGEERPGTSEAPRPPATTPAVNRPGSLIECMTGLRSLSVRCPYAPEIELGADSSGLIHAAGWAGRGGSAGVVAEVLTAAQWAREHAAILAQFTGGPAQGEAVAHLVTDAAATVRWLGGAEIRLHLAARAGPGWALAEL